CAGGGSSRPAPPPRCGSFLYSTAPRPPARPPSQPRRHPRGRRPPRSRNCAATLHLPRRMFRSWGFLLESIAWTLVVRKTLSRPLPRRPVVLGLGVRLDRSPSGTTEARQQSLGACLRLGCITAIRFGVVVARLG